MEVFWWVACVAVVGGLVGARLLERRRLLGRIAALEGESAALRRLHGEDEGKLKAILSGMVEGLAVVDGKHVIRLVNRSFVEMFGLRSDPAGMTMLEAVREAPVEALVREALGTGERQTREISIYLPGAKARHFAVSAVPGREPRGVVMVFHDVTRVREVEEMRREFVANVSHELRTPLAIFQGYVETLRDSPDMPPEEVDRILEVMDRHSRRLNAIVEDLLTLARIEARSDELEREALDAAEVLGGMEEDWRRAADARGVRLETRVDPRVPSLYADRFRVEQVCNNLLDNAIKYTPRGGRVTIGVGPWLEGGAGGAEVWVADTGSGIPPHAIPHVFERFYRVDKARSREAGGTGLGLSIVKHIAALHGGDVAAESAAGAGTTVRVRFPGEPLAAAAGSGPADGEGGH